MRKVILERVVGPVMLGLFHKIFGTILTLLTQKKNKRVIAAHLLTWFSHILFWGSNDVN